MNKWLKVGTVATLVAVVALMALGAGAALAQGPTVTPPLAGLGLHLGGPQNSLVAVAAQALGMERTALIAELNAGKTIADVAKAKGVAVAKIVDAMVANRTAALKAAVDAKRITQAQMDAELAALKANVTAQLGAKWTPRGAGMGRGYGMGSGAGFVDANKDGICDNCGATNPTGQPLGPRGRWTR
ncbi:MAG: hypothetical protein HY782_22250 [Chloroflexi bacterium]|nr:hypothetical protein [Chloroflexota bacterium]